MKSAVATAAIKGILNACDDKTKQAVMKLISDQETTSKSFKTPVVTLIQAKENLIRTHFKL